MRRVLLDQNIPRGVRRALSAHTVKSALELGWDELTNGDLLRSGEAASYEVVVTARCAPYRTINRRCDMVRSGAICVSC